MWNKKFIFWLIVIFWLVFIFTLSSQTVKESSDLSEKITTKIINNMPIGKNANIDKIEHLIRKNAHFFLYLVLSILLMIAFKSINLKENKAILITLIISILYAISDEIHQVFVPGRGGQIKDVFIDTLGSITGIIIYKILLRRIRNRK